MQKPTAYEKNNLPIEVREKYSEIIEKYQIIVHYENGVIDKQEFINEFMKRKKVKPQKCKCRKATFTRTVDADFNCLCGKCGHPI